MFIIGVKHGLERERVYFVAHNERHTKKLKISIMYRRIVKLATGSCEGTSGLRVEQQPNIIVLKKKKKIRKNKNNQRCFVTWNRAI